MAGLIIHLVVTQILVLLLLRLVAEMVLHEIMYSLVLVLTAEAVLMLMQVIILVLLEAWHIKVAEDTIFLLGLELVAEVVRAEMVEIREPTTQGHQVVVVLDYLLQFMTEVQNGIREAGAGVHMLGIPQELEPMGEEMVAIVLQMVRQELLTQVVGVEVLVCPPPWVVREVQE
jgi:hypothetical protein